MAGSAILKIDVLADATKAVAGLKSVGTEATKQSKSVTTFGSKSKTAFTGVTTSVASMALGGLGAATAITALGGALVDASKAAMEDEKSQALLAKAMQNNLDATDEQIASMETWIDKTARATGVADDELRPALNNLIIAGQGAEEAQRTLGLALDIAAAKGLDVETVTKALAKAYQGNMGSLSKLGIEIKDADGKTVSFEKAMSKAAETMGGSAAVAAATLEGKMKKAKVAVDEAKESVGGWVNVQLAKAIEGVTFLNASMDGANKANELYTIGIEGVRDQLDKTHPEVKLLGEDVATLATALIFTADHALAPTTDAFMEQVTALNLTEGETRKLSEKIDELAADNILGRKSANEFMGALDDQADAMASTREDGRLLSERYQDLGDDAAEAAAKAAGYRKELRKQADAMKALTDPVAALRDAQREYNAAFKRWSDLSVDGKANADDLREAEDDLTLAHLDLKVAQGDVEKSAGKMEDAWNDARAEAGLLTDITLQSKDAIDQWSQAVNNAPRWHPGTGTSGGPTPVMSGGPVFAGGMYTVGEAGRELFVPSVSGRILPHFQTERMLTGSAVGGGGSTYVMNMNVKRADPADVAWGFRRLELLRTGR